MSSSHMRISLESEQQEGPLLTQEQIKLVKTVLKDQPSFIFATTKLAELIKEHQEQLKANRDGESKESELIPDNVEIPYRILKVKGEKEEQDKYYAVGKGMKSGKALGAGVEGTVKRIMDLDTGVEYALKVIKLSDDYNDGVEEWEANYQFQIMQKLGMAHAVQLKKSISEQDKKERATKTYMIMSLEKGKNLHALLRDHVDEKIHIPAPAWIKICLVIVTAENDLIKDNGVFHRDLKLDNIIYDEVSGKVAIVDFGCACLHKDKPVITNDPRSLGTSGYQSPEIESPDYGENPSYSEKSEVYALGHMLQEIFGFEDFEEPVEMNRVIRNNMTRDELTNLTPDLFMELEELMNTMKSESVDDRPSISDVVDRLKDIYSKYVAFSMSDLSSSLMSSSAAATSTPSASNQLVYPPSPFSDSRLFTSPSPSSDSRSLVTPSPYGDNKSVSYSSGLFSPIREEESSSSEKISPRKMTAKKGGQP